MLKYIIFYLRIIHISFEIVFNIPVYFSYLLNIFELMQKQDTRTEHQRLIAVSPDLQNGNGNTIAHGDETNAAIARPQSK